MRRARQLILTAALAPALLGAGTAAAQSNDAYWVSPGAGAVWKNASGQCWRAGYWTPAMANEECDPDLVPKKPMAAPAPAPRPAPAPAPAPKPSAKPAPKPAVLKINSVELFPFDKATLTPEARAKLDKEVIGRLSEFSSIRFINVSGHTDRLGSAQYNQRLSERRAEAVRAYLVSKGADASKIETYGFGKTNPVKSCPGQMGRKALIECLQPNRRVVVDVEGSPR